MDTKSRTQLRQLLETSRHASLGTSADGAPFVSLVPYGASSDLSTFYIYLSKLAMHTQNILADPRVSLMIHEPEDEARDPQTMARISIQGVANEISPQDEGYDNSKLAYLSKNPQAERNFQLGDFMLFGIRPENARFVGGFGRILDLDLQDLIQIAGQR